MAGKKTRKQKEKSQERVENEKEEQRLKLKECEISNRIEKRNQKIRTN